MPLTPYQRIFHNEWLINPASTKYNMVLDQVLSGSLDIDRLNDGWIRFVNGYLILSSNVSKDRENPCWIQRQPMTATSRPLIYHPNELADKDVMSIVSRPFDLENDPLGRAHVIRLGDGRFRLIFVLHHIVIDGASYRSVVAEQSRFYNDPDSTNPISIVVQRKLHQGLCSRFNEMLSANRAQMSDFWNRRLSGVSGEDLAFLRATMPCSIQSSARGAKNRVGEFRFHFKSGTLARVKQLRRRYKLTPYIFGKLIFGILLHRAGGKDAIGVSFPAAIPEGKELIFGAHINNLIMDFRFREDTTMMDLIDAALDYYEELKASRARYLPIHEIVPFASSSSLLDASFVQTDLKDVPMAYEGIEHVEIRHNLNIDLPNKLLFEQELAPDQLNYRVRFDNEILDGDLVRNFISCYRALFSAVLESLLNGESNKRIADYGVLSSSQHNRIVHQWNATDRAWPSNKTVHGLFEEQVQRTPDNIALVCKDVRLTYQKLNERANRLAAYLQSAHAITPGTLISLCLERSEHLLIAILAVLKTGAAYVPLDPAHPDGRVKFILDDTSSSIVLTDETHRERLTKLSNNAAISIECINGPEMRAQLAEQPATNPTTAAQPEDLFYVVYTSGTTAKPKGVLIEHRHITPIIDGIREAYDFTEPSKVTAFTSFGFDVSSSEFFVALLNGGELHLLSEHIRTDVNALSDYLIANEIQYAYLPPAILTALPKKEYPHLTTILYAGEPCDVESGRYWSARKRLFNYYGPTETNIATGKLIQNGDVHLIGRPVANAKVYVLDKTMTPVAFGVIGEMYIGGAAVARGYLNRPELTNERFLANPFQTADEAAENRNARLYKTGDLARYLPDGNIEFIGRNDSQIKLRGYRIELGEIEARLREYAGIHQSVVVVREHPKSGSKFLAAYYVASEVIDETALLSHLRHHLPEYMVPAVVARLDRLPLTINGKVDRNALPAQEPAAGRPIAPPQNAVQEQLCLTFALVLGKEFQEIGIDDDFFHLGGNSILAIRVVHRIHQLLQKEIPVAALFEHKTIRQLSEQLGQLPQLGEIIPPVVSHPEEYLLSFAQERLWFIEALEGGSETYHIPALFRLQPGVCVESLAAALRSVVARHEVLRSVIKSNSRGEGYQSVQEESAFSIERIETASRFEFEQAVARSVQKPFELDRELPIRVAVYHLIDTNEFCLLLIFHHIAFDGWSAGVLTREIAGFYRYFETLPDASQATQHLPWPLPIQYKDYALWQRNRLSGEALARQLAYWKGQLTGYETLQLPTDQPRTTKANYSGAHVGFALDGQVSQQLRQVAQDLRVSLFSVLLSGFYLALRSYSNQEDIVVGIPIANREHPQVRNLIGFFVNTLALRQVMDPAATLAEFIGCVSRSVHEAQAHQDIPFEKVVSALQPEHHASRHPIFQVMFGIEDFAGEASRLISEWLEPCPQLLRGFAPAKFDLTTMLSTDQEEISGSVTYATGLFREQTIQSFVATYKEILSQIGDLAQMPDSGKAIKDLRYFSSENYEKVIHDWNATQREFPQDKTIHQLFEEQVERTPDNVALVFGEVSLTYRQLNERANQLAYYLKQNAGTHPDDRVGLCLDRSEHMVIGMLGVLKSGAAYVPLDPAAPFERNQRLLADSGAQVLVVNEARAADWNRDPGLSLIVVDSPAVSGTLRECPTSNPATTTKSEHLCYVIYTSGSTGQPKGVMVEHRHLLNFVWHKRTFLSHDDVVASYINYTFDAINSDLYPALLNGNKVFLLNDDLRKDISALFAFLMRTEATFLVLPAAVANELCRFDLSRTRLKTMVTGGESFTAPRTTAAIRWLNEYGPTETTVCATLHSCVPGSRPNTIGRPIANVTAYVLDAHRRPVPIGSVGELYIGGAGVARGYLNLPDLTRERFIANPFQTAEESKAQRNARLYKTGDLVRYLPNGDLEFLGRNDAQIKIRGHRIEPTEIESRMVLFDGVTQAAVIARERGATEQRCLVGYYVADRPIDAARLRSYLGEHLPEYMVPEALVAIDRVPLTPNGKLDSKTLPEPKPNNRESFRPAENPIQEQLCRAFAQVLDLQLEEVGIDDDFFRLGGNSILAIRLVHQIHQALDVEVNVAALLASKTVRQLSQQMHAHSSGVRQLNDSASTETLFMIHPGLAGCDVYASLAQRLNEEFRCLGVDSYNLRHTDKITDLSRLANHYISEIDQVQRAAARESYVLLGWSLGGHIALEIAALLETRGIADIRVYLLDTLLSNEPFERLLRTAPTDNEIRQIMERMGHPDRPLQGYKDFLAGEAELSSQPISRILQHTRVVLFKAMEANPPTAMRSLNSVESYVQRTKYNNIEKVLASAEQIRVVKLDRVHHWNILTAEETIAAEIIQTTNHSDAAKRPETFRQTLEAMAHPRLPLRHDGRVNGSSR